MRTAGIATKTKCVFITLDRDEYIKHLKHLKDVKREEEIRWLKSTALFSSWTNTLIQKLYFTMKEVEVSGGQIMTSEQENEPCYKIWVVISG